MRFAVFLYFMLGVYLSTGSEHDGHSIVIVEDDVSSFPSNTLHEVSIGASIHRITFSSKLILIDNPRAKGKKLICRLPTSTPNGSQPLVKSLLLDDIALMSRVAQGIEEELSNLPCITSHWSLGGTGSVADSRYEMYELCYDSHFRRVGRPQNNNLQDLGQSGDETKDVFEIVFGRRGNSDEGRAQASNRFLNQLKEGHPATYREDSSMPIFNNKTGRWELLMGHGDSCVRHVDLPADTNVPNDQANESIGNAPTIPFSTTVFFRCGQRARNLDNSLYSYGVAPRITINRDIGRCHYLVGIEAAAVCEWDAHLRQATISPILCNPL